MAITVGTQLGSHEIVALLGKGGMGEVYRARDTKLKRDVAVKILLEEFSRDRDRVIRFQREAEVLASLNHPHIAAIYGVEEAGGARALVLELVEGPTLAERFAHGPMPIPEALAIALQIAEALEAAHERGIVHRDLKPANIKVTGDGVVKVLDFGLAKATAGDAWGADLSQLPTVTMSGTRAGLILGTPAYMSPEQARGRAVDKRTDIWAFGGVIYEMLSGRMTFAGDTVSDTIAAILEREPAWDGLPDVTPPAVHHLLRRCPEKDPKRRLRDIGAAPFFSPDGRWFGFFITSPTTGMRKVALSGGAPVTVCATGNFAGATWTDDDTIYFVPEMPGGVSSVPASGGQPKEILKIDVENGERILKFPHALLGGRAVLYTVATVDSESFDRSGQAEKVSLPPRSYLHPRISPDGHALAYTAAGPGIPSKVTVVPLQGDRTPRPLDDTKYAQGSPKFSPDGRWLAFCSNESGKPQVYVQAFPGPGPKVQVSNDGGTDPVWKKTGGELFCRNGDRMLGWAGELSRLSVKT